MTLVEGEVELWRTISSLVLHEKIKTIGFVGYRRSIFISPTESRLAGQEQAKRRQGQGVPVGLGFRRGLRFGQGQLKVNAWLVVVGFGEWMRCIGDVGDVGDNAGDGRDGGPAAD
jgi:hypothetical protein